MHQPRFPKEAFRGHTIVHHGLYKGDDSYFVPESEHPEHILLKPYALPAIVAVHLPIMYAIQRFLAPNTMIGSVVAVILYFVIYEYMHWNMHVPRGHFIERFRFFQFLRTHHKLHHKYYQKNFCVLFPLADYVFGSAITEESVAQEKRRREEAIARGEKPGKFLADSTRGSVKSTSRSRRAHRTDPQSRLAQEFMKFKLRRNRPGRRHRKIEDLSDLVSTKHKSE